MERINRDQGIYKQVIGPKRFHVLSGFLTVDEAVNSLFERCLFNMDQYHETVPPEC